MKKREFQKKATAALFKRLVAVYAELGENPNITVSSKFHSSYFKLRLQPDTDFRQADRRT